MARTLRVPLRPLTSGEMELDEASSRYVSRVHRLGEGDTFAAFDPEAETEARVEILGGGPGGGRRVRVRVRVSDVRPSERALRSGVTLLAGLGKGDKPEQVLRDATALGADRIVLVETTRSVARDLGAGRRRRLEAVVVDAARQSGRGNLPAFDGPLPLDAALDAVEGDAVRVCLAPGAEARFSEVVAGSRGRPVVLLVGPEGGLSPEEIDAARRRGFVPASLFGFVLRTETAAVAALAAALALRGTLPPAS